MSKHTPGPWGIADKKIVRYCGDKILTVQTPQYAFDITQVPAMDDSTVWANAHLIAAAPELLEALEWALEWVDAVPKDIALPTMPGFNRDYVNDLIARAKGE